jgi:O-antigen/teichoic acid export membrane protein
VSKPPRPLVERAGWAAFWNAAFFPIKLLIGFASSIIVVRLLRIENFYLYTVTTSLLNTLGLLSDLGIERAMQRLYPEIEMRYGRHGVVRFLLWITLVKGSVLLLFIAALALAPGTWIEMFNLGPNGGLLLLFVGVLLVLGAASDVSVQFIYTHFRQKATNALSVLAAVVNPTLTASFVLLGWGVVGALLALLITTFISVAISLVLALRILGGLSDEAHPKAADMKRPTSRSLRARFVSFASLDYMINWTVYLYDLPFVALVIVSIVSVREAAIVEVAIISLAYKFTRQLLGALVVPLTGVQTPLFARLYAEGRIEGLKTAYATITKFLFLALMPACVGLIVLSRNLLQIFYGQVGRDAVLTSATIHETVACVALLAFGLFGEALMSVALSVLMVYEQYRAVALTRCLAVVSVLLLFLLVPYLGAIGAAIAASTAALLTRGAALAYALARLKLPFPSSFFTRVGMASIVMGLALLPILAYFPPTLPPTILMLLVGVLVFLATFKLLGGIDNADKERFLTLRVPFVKLALRFF